MDRPVGLVRRVSSALLIVGLFACSDGEATEPDTASPDISSTTSEVTTPTTPTTAGEPTTTSTTLQTTPQTTEESSPTTTEHVVPALCEEQLADMLDAVDASIAGARLAPGGDWSLDTAGATFDDRTTDAEEFRYRLGLDCPLRAIQTTGDGGERMVVGAWTGDRRAWVVQATDGPATPYAQEIRFQLFIDQPLGEWVEDQAVWAGTLDTGDTVIVGTDDTAPALAAKAWWNEVPRFEDLEVTIDAERYAIDALVRAGARNVSVAEPAAVGSELAAVQFITPDGLVLIGTIGPTGWFDPAALLFEGDQTVERIGSVDVHVTTGAPDAYAVASVGWECDDHVWYVDSVYGSVAELTAWAATVIDSTC